MAAARTSSMQALRTLQRNQVRSLHMTGVHSSPKPIEAAHKTTYMPMGLQDLRSECRKRTLTASGTKHELVDRLAAHDSLQHRAFSIAMRRITKQQSIKQTPVPSKLSGTLEPSSSQSRHFNTSRANKAVNDSSTVDLAFLPMLNEGEFAVQPAAIRVPILPHVLSDDAEAVLEKHPTTDAAAGGYQDTDAGHSSIMIPQISTVEDKDGSVLSRVSDIGDGHTAEMSVDKIVELSNVISSKAADFVDKVDKEQSALRKVWSGFLDDVFGAASKVAKA